MWRVSKLVIWSGGVEVREYRWRLFIAGWRVRPVFTGSGSTGGVERR